MPIVSAVGAGYDTPHGRGRSAVRGAHVSDEQHKDSITALPTEDFVTAAGGRFLIHRRIGFGGMGEVFLAEDTRLKRPVALKRLPARTRHDERMRARLLGEAERTSALNHPNIAAIYDIVEDEDNLLLVMEYVEGNNLRERLGKPMPLPDFLAIAEECLSALGAAHARGVIHCDVKPENIVISSTGRVKVLDFGIARYLPSDMHTTATDVGTRSLCGTPGYVAPEVLLGQVPSPRADLFSLGVTFFEMLTGYHPFRGVTGSDLGAVQRVLHDEPGGGSEQIPALPPGLDVIVDRMLAKEPAQRYSTADQIATDLRVYAERKVGNYRRRHGLVLVGLVIVLAAAYLVTRWLHPSSHNITFEAGPPASAPVANRQLAVLPFRTIGGKPEDQAYSEGLTETLSAKLNQISNGHDLDVSPAAEVHSLKVDSPERARSELGAQLVLEGSIQHAGKDVRVTYSLVETATKHQLEADTITIAAGDPFALQDRVAEGAARMLQLALGEGERATLSEHGTQVPAAFDTYLKAVGFLQNFDRPENLDTAAALFQRSAQLDANFAGAYAGLGETYWRKYTLTHDAHLVDSARRECKHALALDVSLPAGHICLGQLGNVTGQYEQAASEFQLALNYEPTNDEAYGGLAFAYQRLGRLQDAEQTFLKAVQVRPNSAAPHVLLARFYMQQAQYSKGQDEFRRATELAPQNARYWASRGGADYGAGDYNAAIADLQHAINIRPTDAAYNNLGLAYFAQHRFDQAVNAFEQGAALSTPDQTTMLGNLARAYYWDPPHKAQAHAAYLRAIAAAERALKVNPKDPDAHLLLANYNAMIGERAAALKHLDAALRVQPDDAETMFMAALVYNQSGDQRAALAWLQKAVAHGYSRAEIASAPEFDPLHTDPTFQALLQAK